MRRTRRPVPARLAGAVAALAVAALALAGPAAASVSGPCTGSAVVTGDGEGDQPITIDPVASDGPFVVPTSGTARYQGTISGVPGGEQPFSGEVRLSLPWPLPSVTMYGWDGETEQTEASGTETYDLPPIVPTGVQIPVEATHTQGGVTCSGSVTIELDGSALGPVSIGAGLLALASGAGFAAVVAAPFLSRP